VLSACTLHIFRLFKPCNNCHRHHHTNTNDDDNNNIDNNDDDNDDDDDDDNDDDDISNCTITPIFNDSIFHKY